MTLEEGPADRLPLVAELPDRLRAVEALRRLSHLPYVVFFDSALRHATLGRYSFVAADPFLWFDSDSDEADTISALQQALRNYAASPRLDLPPFQGGAAGVYSYELGRRFEPVVSAAHNDIPTPALAAGLYDVVAAFDHQERRSWLISQGFP
ncbi:MAG: aminodeoxychorismate/anthranilate synthase component I, partial [Planctomycetota bacterium]